MDKTGSVLALMELRVELEPCGWEVSGQSQRGQGQGTRARASPTESVEALASSSCVTAA